MIALEIYFPNSKLPSTVLRIEEESCLRECGYIRKLYQEQETNGSVQTDKHIPTIRFKIHELLKEIDIPECKEALSVENLRTFFCLIENHIVSSNWL